jgi:hypothetical protein
MESDGKDPDFAGGAAASSNNPAPGLGQVLLLSFIYQRNSHRAIVTAQSESPVNCARTRQSQKGNLEQTGTNGIE